MDRTEQAQARAREERERSRAGETGPRSGLSAGPGAEPGTRLEHNVIVFSQTRVIPVPVEHFRKRRALAVLDGDPVSAAYKMLRTAVLQRMRAQGWSSLIVTSPADAEGKTLTAVNLAISLAREVNHTVLLADLDLRRPRLRSYFSDEELPGIGDYLLEGRPLSEILFNPGIDRLVVLPGRSPFGNSSEMLSSPRMVQLARELTTRYPSRMVIYDMPSVLECDDVLAFAPHVDAVLLVVEDGVTDRDELKRAAQVLGGANLIGTVLNRSPAERSTYG